MKLRLEKRKCEIHTDKNIFRKTSRDQVDDITD